MGIFGDLATVLPLMLDEKRLFARLLYRLALIRLAASCLVRYWVSRGLATALSSMLNEKFPIARLLGLSLSICVAVSRLS